MEHGEDTRPSCLGLYTKHVKYAGVDNVYLRSVYYHCVDSSRERSVVDATELMETELLEASSHLHLQDGSRTSDTHTTLLSSPNPTEGEGRISIPTVGHKFSGPPFRLEAGEPKGEYLRAEEGVCIGACDESFPKPDPEILVPSPPPDGPGPSSAAKESARLMESSIKQFRGFPDLHDSWKSTLQE